MNSDYTVEPLIPARFAEAATMLGSAFQNDPVIASILPGISPEKRSHKLAVMFEEMLAVCARRNEPLAIIDGRLVRAAAILHRPGTYPLPLRTEIGLLWRAVRKTGPRGLARFVHWSLRMSRHHPATEHYYLETLGVEPTLQGQGLGSAMLQKIASLLDAADIECVLETANERNIVLYRRFGFQVVSEEHILGAHVRFMRRRPGG